MKCNTAIYHPNIDPTGDENNVCLNLFDEWTSTYGLRDVIQGLLFLFYNPNLEDPLSSYFGDTMSTEEFEDNVRASLRGEDVDDYSFPRNYYGKDPEMLEGKETVKEEKRTDAETEETPTDTEQKPDVETAVEATEENVSVEVTAKPEEEKTVDESANADTADNRTDNVVSDDEMAAPDSEVTEVKVQDIAVVLERVCELMVEHQIDENEEEEETSTNETPNSEEASADTQASDERTQSESEVPNESARTEVESVHTASQNQNEGAETATDNTEEVTEQTDTVDAPVNNEDSDLNAVASPIQRQSSKIERTTDVIETRAPPAEATTTREMFSGDSDVAPGYFDAFPTQPFAVSDFILAVNMFGAACYFIYKSYVR